MKNNFLNEKSKIVCLILIGFYLSGCTSRYYWGANLHPDGSALVRPVPKQIDNDLRTFSQSCANKFIEKDGKSLWGLMSHDLQNAVDQEKFKTQIKEINEKRNLSGKFKQIKSSGRLWLDEMVSRNPYEVFDFFVTEFSLDGKPSVHMFLLVKKEPTKLTIWGLEIHEGSHKGEVPDMTCMPKELKGWKSF